jgi:D-beta-D-heptose 7-phosphate kinase/D-beta-D-heptose 1-phosphate adenosyltransferase
MNHLSEILSEFRRKNVVVIGDIMLDHYLRGEITRLSPEAPVPVVNFKMESFNAGGAGNVAANVASLGARPFLFGIVGKDSAGQKLREILEHIPVPFFPYDEGITTEKIRVIGGKQHIVRIDKEDTIPKNPFFPYLRECLAKCDIVIVSDYAKGTINEEIMQELKRSGKRILVDPKPRNMRLYTEGFLIKLNEKESLEATGANDVNRAGEILREKCASNIIITRGEKGMLLFPLNGSKVEVPTNPKEVYDVVGAGDTVIAVLALAVSSGASLEDSCILANYAAEIKVGKAGTSPVNISELEGMLMRSGSKIKTKSQMKEIIESARARRKKVVWTNGCFDLLHQGHVRYLSKARELGDLLVIGLNSDSSVRQLKGPERPLIAQEARAEVLAALACVDYVTIFDETQATSFLDYLRPDIFVKAGDYDINKIDQSERKVVECYGGKIMFIPVEVDISTTKIVERIRGKDGNR